MTNEELIAKLQSLGLDPSNPTWVKSGSVDLEQLPVLGKQRELLTALKEILQQQVNADVVRLDEATEALSRLQHGGGQ